jgi:hypothetical protein
VVATTASGFSRINWVTTLFLVLTPLVGLIWGALHISMMGVGASELAVFFFYVCATGFSITTGYIGISTVVEARESSRSSICSPPRFSTRCSRGAFLITAATTSTSITTRTPQHHARLFGPTWDGLATDHKR